jgi:hypothetical protein
MEDTADFIPPPEMQVEILRNSLQMMLSVVDMHLHAARRVLETCSPGRVSDAAAVERLLRDVGGAE